MGTPAGSKTQWVSVSQALPQTLPQTSPAILLEITCAKLANFTYVQAFWEGGRESQWNCLKRRKRYIYVL